MKYKERLLLRCIHHFNSDLINNMDHMRISDNARTWDLPHSYILLTRNCLLIFQHVHEIYPHSYILKCTFVFVDISERIWDLPHSYILLTRNCLLIFQSYMGFTPKLHIADPERCVDISARTWNVPHIYKLLTRNCLLIFQHVHGIHPTVTYY